MNLKACPSREDISDYLCGNTSDEQMVAIETHLDTCSKCSDLADQISSFDDRLVAILQSEVSNRYLDEPECRQAFERVRAFAEQSGWSHSEVVALPEIPKHMGSLQIIELVGQGGMGYVYRARHASLGRDYAVKFLAAGRMSNEQSVARFQRETKAIGKLNHPNIVRPTDAGEIDGFHYLVMDYVDGYDLSSLKRATGPLPIADACELIRQTSEGLQCVYENGMVHRDIKPSNLMLDSQGQVKILDLGLSMLHDESEQIDQLTVSGAMMGTYDYMSPEQCNDSSRVTIATDLYSLGCTLYELLAGRPPFSGEGFKGKGEKIAGHLHAEASSIKSLRPEVPKKLVAIVNRLLAKDPADRYKTPAELADALKPMAEGADLKTLFAQMNTSQDVKVDTVGAALERTPVESALVSTEEKSPALQPKAAAPPNRPVGWKSLVALIGFGAAILFVILMSIQTSKGKLVVEIDDPSIEAKVSKDGLTIQDLKTNRSYKVKPGNNPLPDGKYGITISDDAGLKVDTHEFTINHGEKAIVKVSLRKTDKPEEPITNIANTQPPFTQLEITPEPLPVDERIYPQPLAPEPAAIDGVLNWFIDTRDHRGQVLDMECSPDGRLIASIDFFSHVRLWDAKTGKLQKVLQGHTNQGGYVTWSPDGRYFATSANDRTIRIWDVETGRMLKTLQTECYFNSIDWSPDGHVIASKGPNGEIVLWDPVTSEKMYTLQGHEGEVKALIWSPDGKTLVSAGDDGSVRFWDRESGKLKHTYHHSQGCNGSAWELCWSPDGTILVAGGATRGNPNKVLQLIDSSSFQLLKSFPAHENPAYGPHLVWTSDGKLIVSSCYKITFWDPATNEQIRKREFETDILCGTGSIISIPDTNTLIIAGGEGGIQAWDIDELCGDEMPAPKYGFSNMNLNWQSLGMSEDGKVVFAAAGNKEEVHFWDTTTGERIGHIAATKLMCKNATDISRDGSLFVAPTDYYRMANIWEVRTGKKIYQRRSESEIADMALSPDGQTVAIGADDIKLWDLQADRIKSQISINGRKPFVWSPDGSTIAVADEQSIHLFDTETGELCGTLLDGKNKFDVIAWSPDGTKIVGSGNDSPLLSLFEIKTGKLSNIQLDANVQFAAWLDENNIVARDWAGLRNTWNLKSNETTQSDTVQTMTFSRNAEIQFRTGRSAINFWRLDNGRHLPTILALADGKSVLISPDGHFKGSEGIEDELVYVIQTETGQETLTLKQFEAKYGWKNDPAKVQAILQNHL